MPDALISRITSLGPGVGSGNSLSSSFRSPRKTTPFMVSSGALSSCVPEILSHPSCVTPISTAANKKVVTIEAIGNAPVGKTLQAAWVDLGVPQCGYCQAGQIMSAAALLAHNAKPTDAQIDEAMSGNICRCGTYTRIRAAIKQAVAKRGGTQ